MVLHMPYPYVDIHAALYINFIIHGSAHLNTLKCIATFLNDS